MSDISPVGKPAGPATNPVRPRAHGEAAGPSATRGSDRVELSEQALEISHGQESRTDMIDRIRQEIAAGTYETPDKLEAALDRLAVDLVA